MFVTLLEYINGHTFQTEPQTDFVYVHLTNEGKVLLLMLLLLLAWFIWKIYKKFYRKKH